ncbi:hypothetical protein C8R42DRAFT_676063 [Lentinula raphanica]|nr:hypothetical protein C8R42DRAFT_676063 [Lentinula raphanica]
MGHCCSSSAQPKDQSEIMVQSIQGPYEPQLPPSSIKTSLLAKDSVLEIQRSTLTCILFVFSVKSSFHRTSNCSSYRAFSNDLLLSSIHSISTCTGPNTRTCFSLAQVF